MNLTVATLLALVKYPCNSTEVIKDGPKPRRKFGYFKADSGTFQEMRRLFELNDYQRNPLTYLMEAADDIAYSAGDLEDVFKKGLVDFDSVRDLLKTADREPSRGLVRKFLDEPMMGELRRLPKRERQQLAIQRFSQMAIRLMVKVQLRLSYFTGATF